MGLYDCDFDDYDTGYLERIEVAKVAMTCCESGITIPAGQPYAACWLWISDDGMPEGFPEDSPFDDLTSDQQLALLEHSGTVFIQCIEMWRFLRQGNRNNYACASFGNAIEEYRDAVDGGDPIHRLRYLKVKATAKRAKLRYESGKGPRLHPSEAQSLASGEWVSVLPFSVREKQRQAA